MKTINNFCEIINNATAGYKAECETSGNNYGTDSVKEIAEASGLLDGCEYDQNWLDTYEDFHLCSETGEMVQHCNLSLINHAAGDCYVKTDLFKEYLYAIADMGAGAECIEGDPTAAYLLWKLDSEAANKGVLTPADGDEFNEALGRLNFDKTAKVSAIHWGVNGSRYEFCFDYDWTF